MLPTTSGDEPGAGLPPPGSRWGAGAQSVLPYLTKTLQAKPAEAVPPEPRAANDETALAAPGG